LENASEKQDVSEDLGAMVVVPFQLKESHKLVEERKPVCGPFRPNGKPLMEENWIHPE
jgi:hypothetical protein